MDIYSGKVLKIYADVTSKEEELTGLALLNDNRRFLLSTNEGRLKKFVLSNSDEVDFTHSNNQEI